MRRSTGPVVDATENGYRTVREALTNRAMWLELLVNIGC